MKKFLNFVTEKEWEPCIELIYYTHHTVCCVVTIHVLFSVYMIKLGTLENETTADVEWRHHAYVRTAKKRKFLSVE